MTMNLRILAISNIQTFAKQKCLVPSSFLKDVSYENLYKCRDTFGNTFICKVFPLQNIKSSGFCFLDNSVCIKSRNSLGDLVEVIPLEVGACPEQLLLDITVNEKIFKRKKGFFLSGVLTHLLEPYFIVDQCTISSNEMEDFGITDIKVHGFSDVNKAFTISEDTKLIVKNVSLSKPKNFVHSDLGGVKQSYEELLKLPKNLKIQHKSQTALVIGPTGCGKTSLCYNFFLQENANVFPFQAAELFRQYPGETEELLRSIFQNAKQFSRDFNSSNSTVIFVENIDVICPAEETANSPRITAQFVSLLDDLYSSKEKLIVLATTSNAEAVHTSLKRNGRFSKEILVQALDENGRKEVLEIACNKILENVSEELLEYTVKKTPGYVGADLILLVENVFKETSRGSVNLDDAFEKTLRNFKPSSIQSSDVSIYKTTETFQTIGGMNDLKTTFQTSVLRGLEHSETFSRFNLNIPKGILLYGPPGCAKTTFAKCLATEANMTFIATSGAEVYSPYVGCAEKFISKIFDTARKNSPCLIFLDEIDTLIGKRATTGSSGDVQTRILSTLLTEMDGIGLKMRSANLLASENKILVVAATNRPDMIDDALMRPGRFDRLIHVPPPDFESRLAILSIYKEKMPFDDGVDLEVLANLTENFSGSDICNLCNEVAMFAFMRNFDVTKITRNDFEEFLAKTKSSLTLKQIQWYYDFENKRL